jgi:3',5'-cyclic AMP phosphodiesterase CpdA
MQPGAGANPPPNVVGAQVTALSPQPSFILMPGDLANDGTTAQYGFFDTMYGASKAAIFPAPGNHDWVPGTLANYDTYWGSQSQTPAHYYSFDIPGGWHVVALESDAAFVPAPAIGTTQYNWLVTDLAANTSKSLIAYWHHPRWADGIAPADPGGTEDSVVMADVWNLLYDNHADLVLCGHVHSYQRFPKFSKTGLPDNTGIRQFVTGGGGSGLHTLSGPGRAEINSYQVAAYDQLNSKWFGYLKLWLWSGSGPRSYSWQYVSQNAGGSESPGSILDSGGPVPSNRP